MRLGKKLLVSRIAPHGSSSESSVMIPHLESEAEGESTLLAENIVLLSFGISGS